MVQEQTIKLLPLTQAEVEALSLILGAIVISKIEEKCDSDIAKSLWQTAMPHIRKINEKINKGENNGRN